MGIKKRITIPSKKDPVLIFVSDIHLSHNPPRARKGEKKTGWYNAMARPLRELNSLQRKLNVPILCAGDLFDVWDSPAELITFALRELPASMFCIPGQHDLPNWNLADIKQSAYWTLVAAGKIENLPENIDGLPTVINGCEVWAYPWNGQSYPGGQLPYDNDSIKIAILHSYCWKEGYCHQGVTPENEHYTRYLDWSGCFDILVFGDNHEGFIQKEKYTTVVNCGGFYRRRTDQIKYRPFATILYKDKTVVPYYLDCQADVLEDTTEKREQLPVKFKEDFLQSIRDIKKKSAFDFKELVLDYLRSHRDDKRVYETIISIFEECQK
jgi:hypothetical protein